MKEKKWVNKAIRTWTYRLGLRWWHVTFVVTANKKLIKDVLRTRKGKAVLGRTYADWKYRTATIYINVPALKGRTKRYIEQLVVHECMHVLVNEMRMGEIHHEERVATSLTEAIFWTVDDLEKAK
jgi:hypothetical protein